MALKQPTPEMDAFVEECRRLLHLSGSSEAQGASAAGEQVDLLDRQPPSGAIRPATGEAPAAAGKAPPNAGAPMEAKPSEEPRDVKLTLTSETKVAQPSNRARTKLGVGEVVTLKVTPVSGAWTVAGVGTLSSTTGGTVTLTASGKPGTITVSVTAGEDTEKIVFTVVAPNSVHQDTVSTEHYNVGVPNAGFRGQVYCGPDDVNFSNITFLEDEVGCQASGSWASKNGQGHHPNPQALPFTDTVVSGKGTKSVAVDHCWSGYVTGLQLTDWSGTMTFTIPWTYQCGGESGSIATVVQTTTTSKDGTTSTKKAGGSSGDFPLS